MLHVKVTFSRLTRDNFLYLPSLVILKLPCQEGRSKPCLHLNPFLVKLTLAVTQLLNLEKVKVSENLKFLCLFSDLVAIDAG